MKHSIISFRGRHLLLLGDPHFEHRDDASSEEGGNATVKSLEGNSEALKKRRAVPSIPRSREIGCAREHPG